MLNSTATVTPDQAEAIRAFHYRVYLAEAAAHDKQAKYQDSIGQTTCAELFRLRAAQCRAWASEYAPEPILALSQLARDFASQLPDWQDQLCPAAERALIASDVPFVSEAAVRDEQRIEMGA